MIDNPGPNAGQCTCCGLRPYFWELRVTSARASEYAVERKCPICEGVQE